MHIAMEIRDPVHGPIKISPLERRVIDHPLVQRLRRVRQLGFGEQAFPGATHTRFLHSLGTMHLAGRAFSSVAKDLDLPGPEKQRFTAVLRLAALLHDIGHPPLSHSGERILPKAQDLGFDASSRPATHEEMTLYLLLNSDLTELLAKEGRDLGITADLVAAILGDDRCNVHDDFVYKNATILPLLRQLVSGELDVDRMDYLIRDSYFTGVAYGRFDADWILSHLGAYRDGNRYLLALNSPALFTFEHFLLSRFHMFLIVYSHHKTLIYDRMLERFLENAGDFVRLPQMAQSFAKCDDEWLWQRLSESDDIWAQRLVQGRPLVRAVEVWDEDAARLRGLEEEIRAVLPEDTEWIDSQVELSKYFGRQRESLSIMVRMLYTGPSREVAPLEQCSEVFQRYAGRRRVLRIYGPSEKVKDIETAVEKVVKESALQRKP